MRKQFAPIAGAIFLCAVAVAPLGGAASATVINPRPRPHIAPPEAVGLYPTLLTFKDVLRGGRYQDTIGVLNGTDHGQWFHLSLSGRAAPWLKVTPTGGATPINRIRVPNGPSPTQALLQLQVPSTLADGIYHAVLTVWTKPGKTKNNGPTTVGLGGEIEVTVAVSGTEVVAGKLIDAYTYPKLEQGEPLKVSAIVNNSGNVAALPSFHFQIVKKGVHRPVYNWVGTTGEPLLPGQRSTYELRWPASLTEGATLGAYTAKILSVTFPQVKDVGSWALPFRLYPFGSLHRGGKLLSLRLMNKPRVGYSAEVQASVVSSGEVQQETYFVGQLYRNGTFLEGIKSPVPVLLAPADQPGATGVVQVPIPITKTGLYRLTGTANFAGAQSSAKTLTFRVGGVGIPLVYKIAAAAALIVLLLVLISLVALRRRRRGPPHPEGRRHVPPRYTATHPRVLHVPLTEPVGSAPGRSHRRR
jgi:hypothetical protein